MKDPAHHPKKAQKKVIREARQEAEAKEEEAKAESEETPEQEGVEIEEQPTLKRPLNRRFH